MACMTPEQRMMYNAAYINTKYIDPLSSVLPVIPEKTAVDSFVDAFIDLLPELPEVVSVAPPVESNNAADVDLAGALDFWMGS